MTVGLNVGAAEWEGQKVEIVDLPGTYALGSVSDDQYVARRGLLETRPDVVLAVVDATNLARNLYMVLQLLDLGYRVVVALNLVDEARRRGIDVDSQALSHELGVPVVRTVASRGEGIVGLAKTAAFVATSGNGAGRGRDRRYSDSVERRLTVVRQQVTGLSGRDDELPFGLPPRALALAVVEGDKELAELAGLGGDAAVEAADAAAGGLGLRVAAERHAHARDVAAITSDKLATVTADRWWRLTTAPLTGLPIMVVVLAAIFVTLFLVGGWLSSLLTIAWAHSAGPLLQATVHGLFGHGALAGTLLWGLDGGILAALAVGIPYILTFYFVLALLEDSGYMNAAAFLTDRMMHKVGLHGRAVIPLVSAAGCNVPAILGTRVLGTMRERVIASTLATLVPCSARTAVILGAVSLYAGWQWALFVYGVVLVVGVLAGVLLNRMLPGEQEGMIMEMFPFRRPSLKLVGRKTWKRFTGFLWGAAPIIFGGSLVLGALYETGLIWHLTGVMSPVVQGWLGLPAVAGLTLLFAVLRKELALQLLVAFAVVRYGSAAGHNLLRFMTPHQIVVYALVNSIYVPCMATIAVLGRELGWRRAAYISSGTIVLALVVGGAVARALPFL